MRLIALFICLAVSGCASTMSSQQQDSLDLAAATNVFKTSPAVAISGELGSESNPVRVLMPEGEREYLHRLRCDNGAPPAFERRGSAGFGPYGKILDIYTVECPNKSSTIYMDMYHCSEEREPIAGFQIVPEIGTRAKPECR